MHFQRPVIGVAADLVGDPLSVIDGRPVIEMIDSVLIDDLLAVPVQIEEIVLHAAAPSPCAAEDFSGLFDDREDRVLCWNTS